LRLLDALRRRGLPVPVPVAAIYRRALLTYVAELITERIVGARSLSELLLAGAMDDARWAAIGRCLRRFHDAGVQHADLNAQNILLDPQGKVWVLDFDRGRERAPGAWRERALGRLARSLAKIDVARAEWQGGFALLRIAHDG
jgi:3-deoxy-D-manno-octulosonic acid kinase